MESMDSSVLKEREAEHTEKEKKPGGKDGIIIQLADILSIVSTAKSWLSEFPPLTCARLSKRLSLQEYHPCLRPAILANEQK